MKYAFIAVIIILVSSLISFLIISLIDHNLKRKIKTYLKVIFTLLGTIIISISSGLIYLSFYNRAFSSSYKFLKSDETVSVKENRFYYQFDNVSVSDKCLIFYGGAKVEEVSYAPLMSEIAHLGVDVYLIKMPLRFALLDSNRADKVLENNHYQYKYIMGHSLGGTTASRYLKNSVYHYDGIIFLASYSTYKLSSIKCLSIYGSLDGVLDREEYRKNYSNFSSEFIEEIIEGGNHTNFAYYKTQQGDNTASISREEQINLTSQYAFDFIK